MGDDRQGPLPVLRYHVHLLVLADHRAARGAWLTAAGAAGMTSMAGALAAGVFAVVGAIAGHREPARRRLPR